jgi:hypothetical protein
MSKPMGEHAIGDQRSKARRASQPFCISPEAMVLVAVALVVIMSRAGAGDIVLRGPQRVALRTAPGFGRDRNDCHSMTGPASS